jgi:hypothetical protein
MGKDVMGGLCFAWEMGWKIGLWWHKVSKWAMGVMRFNETK